MHGHGGRALPIWKRRDREQLSDVQGAEKFHGVVEVERWIWKAKSRTGASRGSNRLDATTAQASASRQREQLIATASHASTATPGAAGISSEGLDRGPRRERSIDGRSPRAGQVCAGPGRAGLRQSAHGRGGVGCRARGIDQQPGVRPRSALRAAAPMRALSRSPSGSSSEWVGLERQLARTAALRRSLARDRFDRSKQAPAPSTPDTGDPAAKLQETKEEDREHDQAGSRLRAPIRGRQSRALVSGVRHAGGHARCGVHGGEVPARPPEGRARQAALPRRGESREGREAEKPASR